MKNNTKRIKNEIPKLLEAVCTHPDCPEWLKDGIWDVVNDQDHWADYSADWWRSQLSSMITEEEKEERRQRYAAEKSQREEIGDLPPNVIRMEVAQ